MLSSVSLRWLWLGPILVGFINPSQARAESPPMMRLEGTPVTIRPPQQSRESVYLRVWLRMDDGVCKVARGTEQGGFRELFTMGEGTFTQELSPGETIQVDPQGHRGAYTVQFEPAQRAARLRGILASGFGMIVVAVMAIIAWRGISHAAWRWFWIGVGLWTIAVAVKVACALVTNAAVLGFFTRHLSFPLLVACGGLFIGIQSSLCEMGFTLLAGWLWRPLGKEAGPAIAIGVGAGAFEALLLGVVQLGLATAVLAGLPGTESIGEELSKGVALVPLFWLVGPVERIIAILCHASCRALILLGVAHQRLMMVVCGFVIFTGIDGIAGAVHVSGTMESWSVWWIELALSPFAFVSIPILRWCYKASWPEGKETRLPTGEIAPSSAE
jgi:hypothetical protein